VAPPAFQLNGDRTSGQDVRTQNVTAVAAIANIVKTSLGPVGLDKVPVCRLAESLEKQSALCSHKQEELEASI